MADFIKEKGAIYLERSVRQLVRFIPAIAGAALAAVLIFSFLPAEINTRPVFKYSSIYDREEFGTAGINLLGGPVVVHPHVRDYEKMPVTELREFSGIGSSICLSVEVVNRDYRELEIYFELPEKAPPGLKKAVEQWINTLEEYYVCPIESFRFEVVFYPESRRTAINVTEIEGIRSSSGTVFYGPTGVGRHAVNLIPVIYRNPWRPPTVNFTEGTDRIYRKYNKRFKDFVSDDFINL
jgi:hypothetical protein